MNRTLAAALTAAALVWAAVVLCAPIALRSPAWAPAAAVVYTGAARICHQKPERSFHVAGRQLPVCARCAGVYFSAAVGTLAAWIRFRGKLPVSTRAALALAALPTVLTWTLEHLGGVPFSNASRAIAALPLGGIAGWLFVRMLRYDSRLDAEQVLYS